jgi:hypothetical protein
MKDKIMETIFEPISAVDRSTMKYLKEQGYELSLCWMGNTVQDYKVTFRGEYIGNDTDKTRAVLVAIFHDDERNFKMLQ